MNRKGFTLIELIVTIALLAVISLISFVSVSSAIKKNKTNNCNTLVDNIKGAVNEYVSDNRYNGLDVSAITVRKLVEEHYLSSNIINPFTNEDVTDSLTLTIELNSNYTLKSVTVNGINCNN